MLTPAFRLRQCPSSPVLDNIFSPMLLLLRLRSSVLQRVYLLGALDPRCRSFRYIFTLLCEVSYAIAYASFPDHSSTSFSRLWPCISPIMCTCRLLEHDRLVPCTLLKNWTLLALMLMYCHDSLLDSGVSIYQKVSGPTSKSLRRGSWQVLVKHDLPGCGRTAGVRSAICRCW